MNFSGNILPCPIWRPTGFDLLLYETDGFYYTSRAALAMNCLSSPVCAIGNGLVLMVIIRTPSLHTPANILIGFLCVVDFLTGVVVQQMSTAYLSSDNLRFNCVFLSFLILVAFACICTSVSLMAAISFERYMALFLPLRYNSLVTNKRAFIVTIAISVFWISVIGFAQINSVLQVISTIIGVPAWLVLCGTIVFSYIRIIFLVRHHRNQIQSQQAAVSMPTDTASQSKLAVTMGYVIGVSLMCYLPTLISFVMYINVKKLTPATFNTFILTIAIQFMSSSFNPVIYCWRRKEIRQPILSMLRRGLCCGHKDTNNN